MGEVTAVAWGASTHPGRRRKRNEDAFLAAPPLFAVADGMGGHAAGDVASQMAVDALAAATSDGQVTRVDLLEAIRTADTSIFERSAGEQEGMGTTLSGVALTGTSGRLVIFNVGDSRVYRLRDGLLAQLTHDHSVVQELIDDGTISESEAEGHPDRHVVTRSLGFGSGLEIDWWTADAHVGDRYLITSDGLPKELTIDETGEILSSRPDPQSAADQLVLRAVDAGGRDNVTVVILDLGADEATVGAPSSVDHTSLDDDTNPRPATVHELGGAR